VPQHGQGKTNSRQQAILQLVRQRGFATIEAMAEVFGVSAQTVRRDVIQLSNQNLLERYHGGAGLPTGRDRLAYTNRRVRAADEKRRIGARVAREIPNDATLFIDIGTTTEAVAEALLGHRGLRVITNHIAVVSMLCEHTDFEIMLPGGLVRNQDRAITGETTAEFLSRFRVEYGIFGVGAFDADGYLLDYDYRDVHISRTAMNISRKKFFVADSGKFTGDAMVQLVHMSEVDALFTDAPPPPPLAAQLAANEVELIVAPAGAADDGYPEAGKDSASPVSKM